MNPRGPPLQCEQHQPTPLGAARKNAFCQPPKRTGPGAKRYLTNKNPSQGAKARYHSQILAKLKAQQGSGQKEPSLGSKENTGGTSLGLRREDSSTNSIHTTTDTTLSHKTGLDHKAHKNMPDFMTTASDTYTQKTRVSTKSQAPQTTEQMSSIHILSHTIVK